jgi:hypothetical protein
VWARDFVSPRGKGVKVMDEELLKLKLQVELLENRMKGVESLLPDIVNLIDSIIQKISPIKKEENKHDNQCYS